jgi:hypothetical protein
MSSVPTVHSAVGLVLYFGNCVYPHQSSSVHVKWVPCYQDMVHHQVADGGDDLQILRVAAGGHPAWGLGGG